ncbi:putative inorganic phosphate cotransporter [Galleria mellonella]|uniref:Inorganic phosphate cotransporter n=1 Tax=Galleria mellonella TaxID=7137 RepID=A0ABM3M9A1_GALME|nr:putative inorganic phosphate cotransporter [Galleria mellonella]
MVEKSENLKQNANHYNDIGGTEVSGWGQRHQQCILLFLCLTIAYSMRSCMGVSLVAMVKHDISLVEHNNTNHTESVIPHNETITDNNGTEISHANTTNKDSSLYISETEYKAAGFFNALMLTPPYPRFGWSKQVQDSVIASFFWGYVVLQIPAGQLAHRFGSTALLSIALLINCIASLGFPLAAHYGGWVLTVIFRIIQGLSQACVIPSLHTALGKWAPLAERARMSAFVHGGSALGTVLGLPITGFIATSPLGWPGIFRFYGVLSGIMGVAIWLFGADNPAKHPKVSPEERMYIEQDLGQQDADAKKKASVPWSRLLRSRGLYAIVIAHTGYTWGNLFLYSEVPSYMSKIMGVNIKANGMLTALPFFVMWLTNFFFSWLADMIIVKKYFSVTITRKLANSLGCVPAALLFIALAYAPNDIYIVETLLVLICAFNIASHVGFQVNHIDISPNFAGIMMSISNFFSNLVGSLAPIVTGLILKSDPANKYLWRQAFFVASGLYFFTNLLYVLFGTAELADWNDPNDSEKNEKKDEENAPMIQKPNVERNGKS